MDSSLAEQVKRAAVGREIDILADVAGIDRDVLDGKHHPCPRCGGLDRFSLVDESKGAVLCRQCFAKKNGDYIAAVGWMLGCTFPQSLDHLADYLNIDRKPRTKGKRNRKPGFATVQEAMISYGGFLKKKTPGLTIENPLNCWLYHNSDGLPKFAVVRYDTSQGKEYCPFNFDGKQWRSGDPKGRLPLFDLHLIGDAETIWNFEGEKAADAAKEVGLVATTSAHGALSAKKSDWSPLAGRRVVILPDNDSNGEQYATDVVGILQRLKPPATATIRRLPGLPEGGDIADFIELRRSQGKSNDEIRAEIESLPDEGPSDTPSQGDRLSNGEWEYFQNDDGSEGRKFEPLPMRDLIAEINQRTGGWPRRVGDATGAVLFVHGAGEDACLIPTPADLFGWLGSKGVVEWHEKTGCVTKREFHAELRRTARRYVAIENLPHEPPIEGHYYACEDPPASDGKALAGLLDRFSPETHIDRELMQAAIMSLFWGGPGGLRPCFVVTSSDGCGAGKSTLAAMIGRVAGGIISFDRGETAAEIKTRLLSPTALTKRIALLDNIKSLKFGWGELEGLITASEISGKQLYTGEGTRPNTLTWFLTLNGASLSQDMAQRAVIIHVSRPGHSESWEEDTLQFIAANRLAIVADVLSRLRAPARTVSRHTRWALWERAVLSRLPNPEEAQALIIARQGEVDADQEENELIEDYFGQRLKSLLYDPPTSRVFIPSGIAAQWFNQATNERHSVTAVSRQLNRMILEKRFRSIASNPRKDLGRGVLWIGGDSLNSSTSTDLLRRMAEIREAKEADNRNGHSVF